MEHTGRYRVNSPYIQQRSETNEVDQNAHRKLHYKSMTVLSYAYIFVVLNCACWAAEQVQLCDAFIFMPGTKTTSRIRSKRVPSSTSWSRTNKIYSSSLWMSSTQRKNNSDVSIEMKEFDNISDVVPFDEITKTIAPAPTAILPAESESSQEIDSIKDLKHIAFICDGNSRWGKREDAKTKASKRKNNNTHESENMNISSKQQQINKIKGHSKGGERVVSLLQNICTNHPHVEYVTIYGFSSENWSRSPREIHGIFQVIEQTVRSVRDWALRKHLRIKILGDCEDDRVPSSLIQVLRKLEADSERRSYSDSDSRLREDKDSDSDSEERQQQRQPLTLCIAINYGGRNDIIASTRKIAQLIQKGEIDVDDIDTKLFGKFLCTSGVPDPDLVIRTGGERRLSNFLIWNCAYAELYFTDILWPDFDDDELDLALDWYHGRDRRFGGRNDDNMI